MKSLFNESFSVVRGAEMQSSKFEIKGNSSMNIAESDTDDSSVPPAVIRSLRNIRRDVVVDMEGRNSVLR